MGLNCKIYSFAKRFNYIFIVIIAIIADVVSTNFISKMFETAPSSFFLITQMFVLQIFFAPVQSGFSDYCRKTSLITALSCSFLSILPIFAACFFLKLPVVFIFILVEIGLVVESCLGNIIPIAWSALADHQKENIRFFLALTVAAYAIGFMILAFSNSHIPSTSFNNPNPWQVLIPLFLLGISIAFVFLWYHDKKHPLRTYRKEIGFFAHIHSEHADFLKEMHRPATYLGVISYLLWASSQYITLILLVESQIYSASVLKMMYGGFAGVIILYLFKKTSDEKMIKAAFIITVYSFLLFFALNPITNNKSIVLSISCFFNTMANVILSSTILTLFSKERPLREQGKGFGLIVSADSIGYLIGVFSAKEFSLINPDIERVMLFSFIVFLISWPFYLAYERRGKNILRI
jgi:MFS family permease